MSFHDQYEEILVCAQKLKEIAEKLFPINLDSEFKKHLKSNIREAMEHVLEARALLQEVTE